MSGIGNGRTAEEYAKFLLTPFWVDLSARKRRLVGKCEECGGRHHLQSHHKWYPDNWFETTLDGKPLIRWIVELLSRATTKARKP
jgi:hypothetical protein